MSRLRCPAYLALVLCLAASVGGSPASAGGTPPELGLAARGLLGLGDPWKESNPSIGGLR